MFLGWIYGSPFQRWALIQAQDTSTSTSPVPSDALKSILMVALTTRREKELIRANQRRRNRYFRNRNGSRAEQARAHSKFDSEPEEPEEPTPNPTPNPMFNFTFILTEDDYHPDPTLPRPPKPKLYYRISAKYWSWYGKHRRQRKWAPELNDWDEGCEWNPTDLVNDISLPAYDEYYDINYPFYKHAFVLGHVIAPNDNILAVNEFATPKSKNWKEKATSRS